MSLQSTLVSLVARWHFSITLSVQSYDEMSYKIISTAKVIRLHSSFSLLSFGVSWLPQQNFLMPLRAAFQRQPQDLNFASLTRLTSISKSVENYWSSLMGTISCPLQVGRWWRRCNIFRLHSNCSFCSSKVLSGVHPFSFSYMSEPDKYLQSVSIHPMVEQTAHGLTSYCRCSWWHFTIMSKCHWKQASSLVLCVMASDFSGRSI